MAKECQCDDGQAHPTVACEAQGHNTNPTCTLLSTGQCIGRARFGKDDKWTSWKSVTGQLECTREFFDNQDPYPNMAKECQCDDGQAHPTVACEAQGHNTNPTCTLLSTGQCIGRARFGKDDKW